MWDKEARREVGGEWALTVRIASPTDGGHAAVRGAEYRGTVCLLSHSPEVGQVEELSTSLVARIEEVVDDRGVVLLRK